MIIKGSSRSDPEGLARHLLGDENEEVTIVRMEGIGSTSLLEALEGLHLLAAGTRCRKPLYHASINVDRDEASRLTSSQWAEAVDELARTLGLVGHQHVVVRHVKRGREHHHVVFGRVHPRTLRVSRDSFSYKSHETASRTLEQRFGLRGVIGVHTRSKGTPRPAAPTHDDWQAAERTGVPCKDVADRLRAAWSRTKTAKDFLRAIEAEGWSLAMGRRGPVLLVDGTPHSIPRRLGIRANVVHERLAALSSLPTVDEVKHTRRSNMSKKTQYGARSRSARPGVQPALKPGYWEDLGYSVERLADYLLVKLSATTTLLDFGDRMVLDASAEPTDDEIRIMVAAAQSREWKSIRFSGPEAFQRHARLIALRMGYTLDQIELECEDGMPRQLAVGAMPEHVRRKLAPQADPPVPPSEEAVPPPPAPAFIPSFRR